MRSLFAGEGSRRALIRCDGDSNLGLGHVVRCLPLATELVDRHAWDVVFAMTSTGTGTELVERASHPVETSPAGLSEESWMDALVEEIRPDALVIDVRTDLSPAAISRWSDSGALVVVVDDGSDRRLVADVAFCPPVPQVERLGWTQARGERYVGWEWVLLRPEFGGKAASSHSVPRLLVTMGGSDPAGMTMLTIEALEQVEQEFETTIVLGRAFRDEGRLRDALTASVRHYDVLKDVQDMPGVMAAADLAVCSFGVTAYELAAVGVPAIHLCLTEDHLESSSAFLAARIAAGSHLVGTVSASQLAQEVQDLLLDTPWRMALAAQGRSLIDGKGAERIAGVIAEKAGRADV